MTKIAFDLDQAHHQRHAQPGAPAFVPDRLQKFPANLQFWYFAFQALAHGAQPAQIRQLGFGAAEFGNRRCMVGNG
jgi:hypothetical protein